MRLSGIPDSIVSTKRCISTSPEVAVRTLSHVTHCKVVIAFMAEEYNAASSVSSRTKSLVWVSLDEYVNVGRHRTSLLEVYREMYAISSISTVVSASPLG